MPNKGWRRDPDRDAGIVADSAHMSQRALARKYGVNRSRIGQILRLAGIRRPSRPDIILARLKAVTHP